MIKAPTKFQVSAIEEEVRAYTNYLFEILEGMKLKDINTTFNLLLDLVSLDLKQYDKETIELPIGEAVAQEDHTLKIKIQSILPANSAKEDVTAIYQTLYKLFHEFRLNKSPDCPYADDNNAVVLASGARDLYAETYQKKGKLGVRAKKDGVELLSDQVEKIVLATFNSVKKPKPSKEEPASASIERESQSKQLSVESENKRKSESKEILPLFKERKVSLWYQELLDKDLAQRLEQEEKDKEFAIKLQKKYQGF